MFTIGDWLNDETDGHKNCDLELFRQGFEESERRQSIDATTALFIIRTLK
jgi:hypothetical protein